MSYFWLCLASLAAGALNSLAGGGTLLTFPALMAAGVDAVGANATSTVALVPGSLAGAWAYRRELRPARRWLPWLVPPSLVFGGVGALLAVWYPAVFAALVPWLILAATTLFLFQRRVGRWVGSHALDAPPTRATAAGVTAFQCLIALYGGYFGAGAGILMISGLSLLGTGSLVGVNALKTVLGSVINLAAVALFVAYGQVTWPFAGAMAAAAVVGGYSGARLGRVLPAAVLRWSVIGIGFGLAGYYFLRQGLG